MKIGFIQGNAGASGDMLLGAMVDAGFPLHELEKCTEQLKLPAVKIYADQVIRKGITGTKLTVECQEEDQHRHLHDIEEIISKSNLSFRIKEQAIKIFRALATAEAAVHNCAIEKVHFHEVGAVDAIVDIVGSCYGLEYLGIEELFCSPLRVGFGEVKCAHGILPVPAPATVQLLTGIPCYAGDYDGEWVTPTGAAILSTLCAGWMEMPFLTIEKTGCGAGSNEREIPNLLRLVIGKSNIQNLPANEIEVLETNIDDMNPEILPYLGEQLLEIPVLDFQFAPVVMKKGRIGTKITVLIEPDAAPQVLEVIFRETSTLGIRRSRVKRVCLTRETKVVEIYGEPIRIKVGLLNERIVQIAPEYEDCKLVAKTSGLPLKEIYDLAKKIFKEKDENL